MFILFIFGLIIGAIAIIFALQNVAVIAVTFFTWQFEASLALIILLAVLIGAIIGALLTIPGAIRNYFQFERLARRNRELEDRIEKQKKETEEAIVRVSEAALRDNPREVHEVREVHIGG
jgi:lipopolysaccharide assembly protein A